MELMFNTNPTNSAGKYFLIALAVWFFGMPVLVGIPAALIHIIF